MKKTNRQLFHNDESDRKDYEELFIVAEKLKDLLERVSKSGLIQIIGNIEGIANEVGRSFCGSWLGYHSCVYYNGLQPPPPGAFFNPQWGTMKDAFGPLGSKGNWVQFDRLEVIQYILELSGGHNLKEIESKIRPMYDEYNKYKSEIESILTVICNDYDDKYLANTLKDINCLKLPTKREIITHNAPSKRIITGDMAAINQGTMVPPHYDILAEVLCHKFSFDSFHSAYDVAMKAASHIERINKKQKKHERGGMKIFIGHGQSKLWLELKDFLQDRLKLSYAEFNRVSAAGISTKDRLSEMLDSSCMAFLIFTAEDEMADGGFQARMNVIHEAGLFQGRLGFEKAIIVLEDGCEEFSNIFGIGQIRFPKGSISAGFEEIRRVLEREQIINE